MIVDKDLQNMVFSNSLFNGVSKEQIRSFIKPKNFFQVEDGHILFTKEEPANETYLVVEGEIKIKYSDRKKIEYKYITDFFGEEAGKKQQNRQATAVANKTSILYKISSDELNNLVNGISQISNNLNPKSAESEEDHDILKNHIPENLLTGTDSEEQEVINFDEVDDDINSN